MKQLVVFMYGAAGKDRKFGEYFPQMVASDPQLSKLFDVISYRCSAGIFRYIISKDDSTFKAVTRQLKKKLKHESVKYSNVICVCHGISGLVARQFIVEAVARDDPKNIDRLLMFASPNSVSDLERMVDYVSWKDFFEKAVCRHPGTIETLNTAWEANNLNNKIAVKYVLGESDDVVDRSDAVAHWRSGYFTSVPQKDHWDVFKPKAYEDAEFLITKQFLLADAPVQKRYPENLRAISDTLNWELDPSELDAARNDMIHLVDLLNLLPWRSRQLLCALVQKANQISYDEMFVLSSEISRTMNFTAPELNTELTLLKKQGVIDIIDGEDSEKIYLRCMDDKWLIWDQLKAYCQKTGISLRRVIVDLQFDLLDSKKMTS